MLEREFDLSDILSITTGRLVSSRHMEGVYDILNFMTGDELFTHQLPRAARECEPHLLRQHPSLVAANSEAETARLLAWIDEARRTGPDPKQAAQDACNRWVDSLAVTFGRRLPVRPIPTRDHQFLDPISEARSLIGKDRVIVVEED